MARGVRPFGHDRFEERAARAREATGATRLAENVAVNTYSAPEAGERAVEGWMESPAHRSNILGDFQLTGVGAVRSASGTFFITQLFAAP